MTQPESDPFSYELSDFDRRVEAIIERRLKTPSTLPEEFKVYWGPYLELQAMQIPKSQVVGFSSAEVPVGVILPYGVASAPSGWILCDGSAVSRASQSLLFAAIGTTFGAGDGSTTFNVPDLRQRFPMGKAASGTGSTLGGTGGNIDHVHTGPSHSHPLFTAVIAQSGADLPALNSGVTGNAGTGNTGTANPPFQAVTFIIKAV